jgi:cyclophilin family peptidyl-prolyl cis-trans isomerase/HEAT repeat protein
MRMGATMARARGRFNEAAGRAYNRGMTMRHLAAVSVAAISCHGGAPAPARPQVHVPAERVQIAAAEARRVHGFVELEQLVHHADPAVRAHALRGLGRLGTAHAIAALREVVRHGVDADAVAAAAALGIAGATGAIDAQAPADAGAITRELLELSGRVHGRDRAVVFEALGRAGDPSALATLTDAVADPPDADGAEAAALALGRFGRRGLTFDDATRAALVRAATQSDRRFRYAAAYALARERLAPDAAPAFRPDDPVFVALRGLVHDPDTEVRAVAVGALAKRNLAAAAEPTVIDALGDGDWRVAVEAVRALAGEPADAESGRDALAAFTVRAWTLVADGRAHPPAAHVVLEALRALAGHVDRDPVRRALTSIAGAPIAGRDALSLGWAQCLARAALATATGDGATTIEPLGDCGGAALPAFERDVLVANAIAAGAGGTPAERDGLLTALIHSKDVRVKAAAITAAPKLWPALTADERTRLAGEAGDGVSQVDDAAIEASADTIAAYLADPANTSSMRSIVHDGLLARSEKTVNNPEVQITVLGDLATAFDPKHGAAPADTAAAAEHCDAWRADPIRAVAEAARACVTTLRGADPGPAAPRAAPDKPPVDPSTVLGHEVTWTVETTRGTIRIALDPDLAPWHVAAIVALTRAHFYDGLVWHRVVPDFVVQGGDPTGTGAGGPGYTLPAEPGSLLDGGGFTTGAVGIADAGIDTGGSQWFVMHDHAPHLDGRYTRIGAVIAGQDVVDALQVDDRIVAATVDVR